jgi:hypothetical protein
MVSGGTIGREQCWNRQFGDAGKGRCAVCGKTIYRNARPDSKWSWAPGQSRAPSFPGGDGPRRTDVPLCTACSQQVRRREIGEYAALGMILRL